MQEEGGRRCLLQRVEEDGVEHREFAGRGNVSSRREIAQSWSAADV